MVVCTTVTLISAKLHKLTVVTRNVADSQHFGVKVLKRFLAAPKWELHANQAQGSNTRNAVKPKLRRFHRHFD